MQDAIQRNDAIVDGVPLIWCAPPHPRGMLIHVPAFGQAKEHAQPILDHALSLGLAAVAIDAYQHGKRGSEDRQALTQRVFNNFRREMWTIIGETSLDLPRVAAWMRLKFGSPLPVHLTGLSMGGDAAVAAAPFVGEVASVNAIASSPDWKRPGMRDIKTGAEIEQGIADPKAQLLFDTLNPIDHRERFYGLKVHFVVGELDTHVPLEAAYRFRKRVNEGPVPDSVSVTEIPGYKHLDFVAVDWTKYLRF